MKISLITPAPAESRAGNRTTALRWAGLLEDLGHHVAISVDYADDDVDLMVALHAWRSATSIRRFRIRYPERPLVVALSGTDIYRDIETHRDAVLLSLNDADALVGLHDLVADALPARFRAKLSIIYQSAKPTTRGEAKATDRFDVLVVGHLRDEKDPLRAALAARLLPSSSRIAVTHLGKAHSPDWAARAEAEMRDNARYAWLGEVSEGEVRLWLSRARVMVLSSVMEGGANVISEAIVAGTAVVASRIDGSVGLLGPDYPGFFPTGDTHALAAMLARTEADPAFLATLELSLDRRAPRFTPQHETEAWRSLIAKTMRALHRKSTSEATITEAI